MRWVDDAEFSGFEFKPLACRPGASYWEEIPMTENGVTMGMWPTCGRDIF